MKALCDNCRFWEAKEEGSCSGLCRRWAPGRNASVRWWATGCTDWCGEHEPKATDRPQPEGASEK